MPVQKRPRVNTQPDHATPSEPAREAPKGKKLKPAKKAKKYFG